eukprot:EG_transcript_21560
MQDWSEVTVPGPGEGRKGPKCTAGASEGQRGPTMGPPAGCNRHGGMGVWYRSKMESGTQTVSNRLGRKNFTPCWRVLRKHHKSTKIGAMPQPGTAKDGRWEGPEKKS